METLTIKLLHERKSRRPHRKCDGYSGKLYTFTWSDEYDAYCFTTSGQEEADDLFNSQGRAMGSYFAPVITLAPSVRPKPLSAVLEHELAIRGIKVPPDTGLESEVVGEALLTTWEKAFAAARASAPVAAPEPVVTPAVLAEPVSTATDPEPVVVRPLKKKPREAVSA